MAYPKEPPDTRHHCLQCGDPLPYGGRPDRKFCSQDCRSKYHNIRRLSSREQAEIRVLLLLRHNYDILRRLVIMGVHSIDSGTLLELGFRPEYVTCCRKVGKRVMMGCFDIIYESTPSRLKKMAFINGEGAD